MPTHFSISKEGKELVESGEMDFLHPIQVLWLEISYRIEGSITKENLVEMSDAMVNEFGTVEDAIEAIRDGRVTFKRQKLN